MEETLTANGITWKNVESPSNEELAAFVREVALEPVDAEFVVRDQQRPEIAIRENYILMLVHVPVFDKKIRVTSGVAVYFLITEKSLYTIQYEPVISLQKIIKDFSEHPEKQEEYIRENGLYVALHVISELNISSFRKIRRLAKHIEIAEDAVFHGNERKMVEEVALLTRDVLDFRKILRPQVTLFASMPDKPFTTEIKAQWLRISGQINQLWEVLQSLYESTKELRDTNDSLLQYKENELLRVLTFYSIIAIPMWIFVSPFNPRSDVAAPVDHIVFWSVLGLLLLFLVFMFTRFKRRRVL